MVVNFDDDDVEVSDGASESGSEGLAATETGAESDAEDGDGEREGYGDGNDENPEGNDVALHAERAKPVRQAVQTTDSHLDQELLLLDGPAAREENLLQLQVDELLSEAAFDYEDPAIQAAIDKLTAAVKSIPNQRVSSEAAGTFFSSLNLPAAVILDFKAPDSVQISGAFSTRTLALPDSTIDVLITIPRGCFQQKSHLNHQYHARRALYLATIAEALRGPAFPQQQWDFERGDPRKPVLVVKPKQSGGTQPFSLRLLTAVSEQTFALRKLRPNRNNLRSMLDTSQAAEDGAAEPKLLPTPQYNNSILQDMFRAQAASAVLEADELVPNLRAGILLLKVWSRQHGLEGHADDFDGELLAAFAAHCALSGKLAAAMSPVQVLKATLRYLASDSSFKSGVFMRRNLPTEAPKAEPPPPPLNFKGLFDVLLVDPSGWVNLAAHVSRAALKQVQAAARQTLALLTKMLSAEIAFPAAFLPHHPPTASYDYFWRIHPPQAPFEELLHRDLPAWRLQERKLARICGQALGSRILCLRTFSRHPAPAASLGAAALREQCLVIAAQVDPHTYDRVVDIGPPGDSPQALHFRQFWGPKSELRRFQDGQICEAVAWEVGPAQRHTVPDLAVQYAVERHMPGAKVLGLSSLLDWTLASQTTPADDLVTARRQMEAAQVKLGKQLRSLTSLTLKVVSVTPLSSVALQTVATTPLPHPLAGGGKFHAAAAVARCLEPIELFVQLEGSGRWPDAWAAFQKMKSALGVQLAEELFTGFGLRAEASEECIDVFADGFVFRLFLHSDRDQAMAERYPGKDTAYKQRQVAAAHHGLISQISAASPSYRGAARLASRWISAHLLSNHVASPAVDLLAAAAYCPGTALGPPGSALAGFLRFLRLLGEHPWRERPVVIDPDGTMDTIRRQACLSSFAKAQAEGFAPALPIATPSDPAAAHFTATRPDKQVAARLVALACKSSALLQDVIMKGSPAPEAAAAAVFDPAIVDFDAVILLQRQALPHGHMALASPSDASRPAIDRQLAAAGFPGDVSDTPQVSKHARAVLSAIPPDVVARWGKARITRELLVGFDPVRLLIAKLEERFGHLGLFFADFEGGSAIAIKWKPKAFEARALEPDKAHSCLPLHVAGEASEARRKKAKLSREIVQTVPDILRVLTEIKLLGVGLVADVRLKHDASL